MLDDLAALRLTNRLYARLTDRRYDVEKFERYFRGDQPLAYASSEWRAFHERRFEKFSDNWCGVVASSPAERLKLDGIRIGDGVEVFDDAERLLMRDWHVNELDTQSSQGFLHSIVAGRSFVNVWHSGDDADPVSVEWERADDVIVAYAPGSRRQRLYALKSWVDDDHEFATLYTPSEIWKFERERSEVTERRGRTESGLYVSTESTTNETGGWLPRDVDGETWPMPNPLGEVPIVEFPNRPILGGEPVSDIAGTVAMQDAVNLLWAYLFAAADYASMPARVVMGQEPPKIPILDSNGVKIGEKPVDSDELKRGRMLWLTGQNTKVGQWEPARLDGFADIVNRCVRHIAAQTRTPIHYIVGEMTNVNGETLLAGESGLVNKVVESHLSYGPAARDMFRLAALVRNDQALASSVKTATILWRDPATHTLAQVSDAAIKDKAVGFPFEWIAARRYGMTPDEVSQLLAMRDSEAERVLGGDIAALMGPKPEPDPVDPSTV